MLKHAATAADAGVGSPARRRRQRQAAAPFLQEPSVEGQAYCWEGNLRVGAKVSPAWRCFGSEFDLSETVVGSGMSGAVLLARPKRRFSCEELCVEDDEMAALPSGSSVASTATARGSSSSGRDWVAVKTLEKKGLSDSQVQRLLMEVDIYLKMDHVNIVKLLRVFNEQDKVYLVMEYCSGGSLCDRLMNSGPFSDQAAAAAVEQVLGAVNYCHCHPEGKVCHRDLKHSNFVYKSDAEGAPLKLVDFGLSRVLRPHRPQISSYAGTLYYMAPEVVQRQSYNESCDLWSAGVIAYSLLSGEAPFKAATDKGVAKAIARADLSMNGEVWTGISEPAKDFIRQLLQVDPLKRPSAEQALQHPWLLAAASKGGAAGVTGGVQVPVPLCADFLERIRRFAHESAVRRAAAALVVYSCTALTFDETARILEAQFRALDADGNGTISPTELVQALQNHLGVPPTEAQWIFSQLDLDGDAGLHHSEFLTAVLGTRLLGCADTVREAFSRFDLDCDGKIDLGELLAVLGPRFCGTPTQEIFDELDTNGDHAVDLDEFSTGIASTGNSPFQPELEPAPESLLGSENVAPAAVPVDGGGNRGAAGEDSVPSRHAGGADHSSASPREPAAQAAPEGPRQKPLPPLSTKAVLAIEAPGHRSRPTVSDYLDALRLASAALSRASQQSGLDRVSSERCTTAGLKAQSWGAGCATRPPRLPGGSRRRHRAGTCIPAAAGAAKPTAAALAAKAPPAAAGQVSAGPPTGVGEKAASLRQRRPLSPRTTASFSALSWASARSALSHGPSSSNVLLSGDGAAALADTAAADAANTPP